jgi:tRNA modification GTPase
MTILALSSGSGISGVAVIRISGPDTKEIIKLLTKSKLPEPRKATLLKLNNINTSELIDEGIVLWFPGPKSYTGEDMAELHVHGSPAVITELQNTLLKTEKCRLAEPGEFTKLAFVNGKINLLKAEGIGDLINAETEMQRKQAIEIMQGKSAHTFNGLRDKLLKILSHVEAKIDFPEEDLPKKILNEIKKNSNEVILSLEKILNDQKIGERIREGFKIAIIGPTNAGKSSLLNNLSNREVAIVSEVAGTTRDIIETHLNIEGYPVTISDTAGIRDSKNEIEQRGITLALKKAEEADLKLLITEPKSLDIKGFLSKHGDQNTILVVNKSDLMNGKLADKIKELNPILISIKNNENINELIKMITKKLKSKFFQNKEILISRERHRHNLKECLEHLKNFEKKNSLENFDLAAEDLRLATKNLGVIVGNVDVEEILDSIFNDFCIGK